MAGYLPVRSNDTLSHLSLPGSPESLCGRLVVNEDAPNSWAVSPNPSTGSGGVLLECDVCNTLSQGGSLLKQTQATPYGAPDRECPHCEDGVDASGLACLDCGGTGWLGEDDEDSSLSSYLQGIDTEYPRGTRVAATSTQCENCGAMAEVTKTVGNEQHCLNCALVPTNTNTRFYDQDDRTDKVNRLRNAKAGQSKVSTNWTRDGDAIENGFEVVISKEQAARTPFLDYTRVSVSEKRECPDCNEEHWLSKIASCAGCDGLKCVTCFDTIELGGFMGTCKKCAGAESDLSYESNYEDSQGDQDRWLSYLMAEDDPQLDPLFLPNDIE